MKEKRCEFCNELFIPKSSSQRYCKRPHYMRCPVCGKDYLVTNNENLKRPPVACSYECRKVRREQTSMERYGIKAPGNNPQARIKAKQTMQEKYGVDYAMQSEEIRNKAKEVLIERYGVDNAQKDPTIRKKCEKTNLERYGSKTYLTSSEGIEQYRNKMMEQYGVEHPIQNDSIKEKIKATQLSKYGAEWFPASEVGQKKIHEIVKQKYGVEYVTQLESTKAKTRLTCLQKYGETNPSKNKEIKKRIKQTMIDRYGTDSVMRIPSIKDKIMKTTMERYGVPFYIMRDEVRKSSGAISQLNIKFQSKLAAENVMSALEFHIGSLSYDLIVPEQHLLVELNPSYTHSLIGNHWSKDGEPADYHLNRCKMAHANGYDLRCIFDWDADDELIQEITTIKKTIDIADCTTFMLRRKIGVEFMNTYGRSRNKHYPKKTLFFGLVKDGQVELAAVIGLNRCPLVSTSYQIIDYGTRYDVKCDQGFWEIMKFVKELIDLNDICLGIDADRVMMDDIKNFNLDLNSVRYTSPQLFWSKKDIRIPIKQREDDFKMLEDGWLPVCDCGQAIYTYSSNR